MNIESLMAPLLLLVVSAPILYLIVSTYIVEKKYRSLTAVITATVGLVIFLLLLIAAYWLYNINR